MTRPRAPWHVSTTYNNLIVLVDWWRCQSRTHQHHDSTTELCHQLFSGSGIVTRHRALWHVRRLVCLIPINCCRCILLSVTMPWLPTTWGTCLNFSVLDFDLWDTQRQLTVIMINITKSSIPINHQASVNDQYLINSWSIVTVKTSPSSFFYRFWYSEIPKAYK